MHFEVKPFVFLKAANDLEQVPLRIAVGAEHALQAVGRLLGTAPVAAVLERR